MEPTRLVLLPKRLPLYYNQVYDEGAHKQVITVAWHCIALHCIAFVIHPGVMRWRGGIEVRSKS
jgi:hypothetical protein